MGASYHEVVIVDESFFDPIIITEADWEGVAQPILIDRRRRSSHHSIAID